MNNRTILFDRIFLAIKLALLATGIYSLFTRLWACEDAYITFRYVVNFLHGDGLVYNLGDRVEGFTHPLWLFLITIPSALGISPRSGSLIISLILTLVSLYLLAFRDKNQDGNPVMFPFAFLLLLSHGGFRDFSVSGLEIPLTFLLMTLFFISYKQYELLDRPVYHGTLLSLLYLTRPELILIPILFLGQPAIKTVYYLLTKKAVAIFAELLKYLRFFAPLVLFAGGYHLFRWLYYGEIFPNTYYAKDGLGAYWSQGQLYLVHFWRFSPVLSIVTLSVLFGSIFSRSVRNSVMGSRSFMMWGIIVVLLIYVTRLGGDFMAYRFLLPVLLIIAYLTNDLADILFAERRWYPVAASGLALVAILLVIFPYQAPQRVGHIADERQYYDLYHPAYRAFFEDPIDHKWYKAGMMMHQFQQSINYPIIKAAGNIGYYGYAAGSQVTIVDVYGLVDRQTARNWGMVTYRTRPGHENKLSLEMALDKNVMLYDTPFDDWNQMMTTSYGVIISLDRNLLKAFPENVALLKDYKRKIASGVLPRTEVVDFLTFLEQKHHVRVEDL